MEETKPENIIPFIQPELPKQSNKKFIVLIGLVSLLVICVGAYMYSKNKEVKSENTLETTQTLPSEGFDSYSNKAFGSLYPKDWVVTEEIWNSYGCNAQADFVQNPVLQWSLLNDDGGTDNLHNLKNPGSVISVRGGVGGNTQSFNQYKKTLSDIYKGDRSIQLSFLQDKVEVTNKKLDTDGQTPSLTYYFNFPVYKKNGVSKSIVLNGKFPQVISITYIAPEKDFSEELFDTIVSSLTNRLKEATCTNAIDMQKYNDLRTTLSNINLVYGQKIDLNSGNYSFFPQENIKDVKIGTGEVAKYGDKAVVNISSVLMRGNIYNDPWVPAGKHIVGGGDAYFNHKINLNTTIDSYESYALGVIGMRVGGIRKITFITSGGFWFLGAGPDAISIKDKESVTYTVELVSLLPN